MRFNISNTKMNNNAAAIYGGGYNSDVTGDIFIHIKEKQPYLRGLGRRNRRFHHNRWCYNHRG